MKKPIHILLAGMLGLSISLSACGNNSGESGKKEEETIRETIAETVEESTEIETEEDTWEYNPNKINIFEDYALWSPDSYDRGILIPQGVDSINEDYYHTLPDMEEYTSGKIVIGDSRCCQMGIFEQVYDMHDFAVFAVWGGHYFENRGFNILAESNLIDIKACFEKQVEVTGECTIYLFATVNDYKYEPDANDGNIDAVIDAAKTLSEFKTYADGTTHSPIIKVIGFDGCVEEGDLYGTPSEVFNEYIYEFSEKLESELKAEGFNDYTTVMDIVGGKAGFISDGLHYDELTIKALRDYIKKDTD